MGIFDDRDQALDPAAPLQWRPAPPDRSVPCECGAWVELKGKRNHCGCGRTYNIYAQLVGHVSQPPARDDDD